MIRHLTISAMTMATLLATVEPARAAPITNSFGLAAPFQTITFDEIVLPAFTTVTNEYSSLGVVFEVPFPNSLGYSTPGSAVGFPNINGLSSAFLRWEIGRIGQSHSWSIHFNSPVSEAAFALAQAGNIFNDPFISNPVTFTALLGSSVVEQFNVTVSNFDSNNYFGFSGPVFDEISVTLSPNVIGALFDNLQTGAATAAVPEPGSVVLLGMGVIFLVGRGRRRVWRAAAVRVGEIWPGDRKRIGACGRCLMFSR